MKTWWEAVCDEHKIFFWLYVDSPSRTEWLLGEYDEKISTLLSEHYGCVLRLVHNDIDLDDLYNNGYTRIQLSKGSIDRGNGWVRFEAREKPPENKSNFDTARLVVDAEGRETLQPGRVVFGDDVCYCSCSGCTHCEKRL
jgi:hypothetical protein